MARMVLIARRVLRPSLVVVTLLLVFVISYISCIHEFLAVTRPFRQGILIVEAWIPQETIAEVPAVFNKGRYQYIVVVGSANGRREQGSSSTIDLAASYLKALGIESMILRKITVPEDATYRTYASAIAVKQWLIREKIPVKFLDVFSVGIHARKSRLLFQHVTAGDFQVGIIAGKEHSYNTKYWVLSLRGMTLVIRNTLGYLYFRAWVWWE